MQRLLDKYVKTAPALVARIEENLAEDLTAFAFPAAQRRRLRTANRVERLHQEIKRRTRVATQYPNEASCLQLVSAIVMEISEEWVTGSAQWRMLPK